MLNLKVCTHIKWSTYLLWLPWPTRLWTDTIYIKTGCVCLFPVSTRKLRIKTVAHTKQQDLTAWFLSTISCFHISYVYSRPVAIAEFSKFAVILNAALSQHHLLGYEIAQLEFHQLHFPCDSAGKEPVHNEGDLGSIPGLGRFPGEGNSYPL